MEMQCHSLSEINKLYIRISPQYVHNLFSLWQKFEARQKKTQKNLDVSERLECPRREY